MEKMENLFDRLAAMNEGEEEIDEETRLEEERLARWVAAEMGLNLEK